MIGMIALWLCFNGIGCRYVHAGYSWEGACIADRDLFNHKVLIGAKYECRKQEMKWTIIE